MLKVLSQVPDPKVVVAIGSCPASGNVFKDSYAIDGPLDKWIKVDVTQGDRGKSRGVSNM